MTNLPLHPVIVHLPMALAVLVPLVGLALAVAIRREWLPLRSWAVVVVLQALLVGSGFVALRTGEEEEERVEHRISESAIERHEEKAEQFLWVAGLTLVIVGGTLVARQPLMAQRLMVGALCATLATAAMGVRVGHAGGELVYGDRGLIERNVQAK